MPSPFTFGTGVFDVERIRKVGFAVAFPQVFFVDGFYVFEV